MLRLKKLSHNYLGIIKEFPVSITLFLAGTIVLAFQFTYSNSGSFVYAQLLPFIIIFLYLFSLGTLLCESMHRYGKSLDSDYSIKSAKNIIRYTTIILISFVVSVTCPFFYMIYYNNHASDTLSLILHDYLLMEIAACYGVCCICLIIYYFYKKSAESFETYCAKAFGGLMKGFVVYGIIAIGVMVIIGIFDTLILDTYEYDLLERVEILLLGLVLYPCTLAGLSKTQNKLSAFAKIVLSYVFTSILMIAFLIIYIYIFKIIITRHFPSNEVFSILTALFTCGLPIWTMAMGCCEDKFKRYFKLMPFLFVPFIILQIMCIYMRVHSYGLTLSRYAGIALIVFEIAYFIMYSYSFLSKKDFTCSLLFMLMATAFLCLLIPGTNYKSAILASQKAKIEDYLSSGTQSDNYIKHNAYEAYKTIKDSCGYKGQKYINSVLSEGEISDIKDYSDYEYDSTSSYFVISANNDIKQLDIEGYSVLNVYDFTYYDFTESEYDLTDFPVIYDDEELGRIDILALINKLMEIDQKDLGNEDELCSEAIKEEIPLKDGGKLIITYLYLSGDYDKDQPLESLDLQFYLLK
ncbi:MAG: DUF4153 domain-containing protein [Lachnospiraceae bacterium]|nr:DUF4153 domain-containing protein [Lachnospiraceae bacterium]